MGKSIITVGAQWGDEGKGKVVDCLAERADSVVRFQGGNNAGHTLVVAEEEKILHLVPSGVLQENTRCFIGAGVVINPDLLIEEITSLREAGYLTTDGAMGVDPQASIIMPYHIAADLANEGVKEGTKIGTTGRGIGPCHEDRAHRKSNITFGDITNGRELHEKLIYCVAKKNRDLSDLGATKQFEVSQLEDQMLALGKKLAEFSTDVSDELFKLKARGANILYEGAQGGFLDVIFGTKPFVTSSHTLSGSACVGAGVGPTTIDEVLAVTKAYTTRVGNGPFPTELFDETGAKIQREGNEFGATTGRPRRCGWLDYVMLRRAVRNSGITGWAVSKIDILGMLNDIQVCTAYIIDGERHEIFPAEGINGRKVEPLYEDMPAGWGADPHHLNAQTYLGRLERETGVPVKLISYGADRKKLEVIQEVW